jgi:hypothetical protein
MLFVGLNVTVTPASVSLEVASNGVPHRNLPGKAQAGQGSRPPITPTGENKLRTRATNDEFSVAGDCATLCNSITLPTPQE